MIMYCGFDGDSGYGCNGGCEFDGGCGCGCEFDGNFYNLSFIPVNNTLIKFMAYSTVTSISRAHLTAMGVS